MNPVLTLETTAYTLEQLISLPEAQIALAGRSNVGKSSLINALAGRKKLAKVSSTPGKTRSVNYYRVTPHDFYLVDLPGYGYAPQAIRSEKNGRACLSGIWWNAQASRPWPCCSTAALNPRCSIKISLPLPVPTA